VQVVIGLVTGALVGAVFALAGAQAPAPPTAAGVVGVAGIAAGYALVRWLKGGSE
jgi:XapX domain-containing protein